MKILVTGSGSGLGKAIFEKLSAAGHDVIPFDILDGFDVCEPINLMDLNEPLDMLINCAGINCNEWFGEISPDSLYKVMSVNAFSFVYMTQAFMDNLVAAEKPTVINIVSNAAHIPMTSSLAYNASKAAGLMITKQMQHELGPKYGLTVFSISPNKLAGTAMSKQIEDNVCKTRGWTPEFAAEYQKKALVHGQETEPHLIATFIDDIIKSGAYYYMGGTDIPFGK